MDRIISSLIRSLEFEKRHYRSYMNISSDLFHNTFENIKDRLNACSECPLSSTAANKVMGNGSIDADIMLIGEAPGATEDAIGKPFVGRAGEKLTQMLQYIGLERSDVYITNIVKCRPPENRDPRSEEIEACAGFLEMEIELVDPGFIMPLGRFASRHILGREGRMKDLSGHVFQKDNRCIIPTYHPSSLLIQKGERYKETRKRIADDLKRMQALLEGSDNG